MPMRFGKIWPPDLRRRGDMLSEGWAGNAGPVGRGAHPLVSQVLRLSRQFI